ncbi:hypothetical protein ABNF97_17155 [Plantactinospora sp. B6F1]|uniref:hypothetical protein n=1 Tax=Plantactinospora sp. B6F1 TaxID=3158971 RepID=UPI0032D91151
MSSGEEIQRHLVVFDCNVYLDVARIIGQPFTWSDFDAAAARLARITIPHPKDGAQDSLRALAACTSGRFAGDEALEVWTSSHIDTIVRGKASQPVKPDPRTGYHGMGWSPEDAQELVDELIYGLVEKSGGGSVGDLFPDGNPPLDHEDGMVFGVCRQLAAEDPLARVYCVTRDRGFLDAYTSGGLSRHSYVLPPAKFIALTRAARMRHSANRISRQRN